MGEEIAALAARIDAAIYELLVLIRKFDEQEGWNCDLLSCAHWLTWRIGFAPSAARERVRVAQALGDLPLMSEAMKRGQLSDSNVRALTRIARPDTEKSLVDLGKAGTAAHAERVVREWRRIDRTLEASDDELRDASSHVGNPDRRERHVRDSRTPGTGSGRGVDEGDPRHRPGLPGVRSPRRKSG